MLEQIILGFPNTYVKMALKKCAAVGMPASTTAMMNIECEPTDCPPPLMNLWFVGTRNDPTSTVRQ